MQTQPSDDPMVLLARDADIPVVHAYVKPRPVEIEGGFSGNAYARASQRAPRLAEPAGALTVDEIVELLGLQSRASSRPRGASEMPLTTQEAKRVVESAYRHARENGWRVTVAVVDEGGLLKLLSRMDGAGPSSSQIAESRAVGAALWRRGGDGLVDVEKSRPGFFAGVSRLVWLPILPAPRSVLIRRGDAVLGAVAVSAATAEQDKKCALAGLVSIGEVSE